jgi:hypothetical protein
MLLRVLHYHQQLVFLIDQRHQHRHRRQHHILAHPDYQHLHYFLVEEKLVEYFQFHQEEYR